jgi:ABC-type branched-subunit amino acid transport system ATPase component
MHVDKNEIVAIVGPNGSGKSTLIKSIYGLATVHDGDVTFQGKVITNMRADKLTRMGVDYVPQLGNTFVGLTVRENLELGILVDKKSRKGDAMERVFQMFPILRERQSQKAGTLSGGERQMLAIGRSLMVMPQLLILDEPTATLSPKFASEVFQKILEIRKQGVTILMVEQNARKALEMSDRGYVLVAGTKAYEGPSKEILSNPEFGRIFLGLAAGR